MEEGRGPKVLKSKSPKIPGSKGAKVQGSHPSVQMTKISQIQIHLVFNEGLPQYFRKQESNAINTHY